MNAIDLLKTDHRVVDALFRQVESTPDSKHKALFKTIKGELDAHAHIEETIFYPRMQKDGDQELKDITKEGIEEHHQMHMFLGEMSKVSGDTFEAKFKVLIEDVRHHVKEEEGEMFPMVEDQFDSAKLELLGKTMEKEKKKYQDSHGIKPASRELAKGALGSMIDTAVNAVTGMFASSADDKAAKKRSASGSSSGAKKASSPSSSKRSSSSATKTSGSASNEKTSSTRSPGKAGSKSGTSSKSKSANAGGGGSSTASRSASKSASGSSGAKTVAGKSGSKTSNSAGAKASGNSGESKKSSPSRESKSSSSTKANGGSRSNPPKVAGNGNGESKSTKAESATAAKASVAGKSSSAKHSTAKKASSKKTSSTSKSSSSRAAR